MEESELGDLRDFQAVSKFIKRVQPNIIFHLAAQPLVIKSYQDPIETFPQCYSTAHILECARLCKSVKAFVNITTDKCYENKEWYGPIGRRIDLAGKTPIQQVKHAQNSHTVFP